MLSKAKGGGGVECDVFVVLLGRKEINAHELIIKKPQLYIFGCVI